MSLQQEPDYRLLLDTQMINVQISHQTNIKGKGTFLPLTKGFREMGTVNKRINISLNKILVLYK